MNAPADPAAFDPVALIAAAAIPAQRARTDGWTPDRRRAFLEAVADGHTADAAARSVGLSRASAYALRRRPAGAAFALGWDAARLLARETVADGLLARAIDGQEERVTRPDGSEIVRFRYDNRLAQHLLTRLDRYADGTAGTDAGIAARLAAQDFDQFLDLVEHDAGPARAALFLRAREPVAAPAGKGVVPAPGPLAGPLAALARADLCARAGAGLAHEVDVADLDPDARAGWTAEQWTRAEAAGLLALAAPEGAGAGERQPCQLGEPEFTDLPVWWNEDLCEWRTRFPPPPGTFVEEDGEWGDEGYERGLSYAEEQVANAAADRNRDVDRADAEAERAAWFAATAAETAGAAGGEVDGEEPRDAAPAVPDEDDAQPWPATEPSSPDPSSSPGGSRGRTAPPPGAEGAFVPPDRGSCPGDERDAAAPPQGSEDAFLPPDLQRYPGDDRRPVAPPPTSAGALPATASCPDAAVPRATPAAVPAVIAAGPTGGPPGPEPRPPAGTDAPARRSCPTPAGAVLPEGASPWIRRI